MVAKGVCAGTRVNPRLIAVLSVNGFWSNGGSFLASETTRLCATLQSPWHHRREWFSTALVSALHWLGMTYSPKSLMGRNQTFLRATFRIGREAGCPHSHALQDVEQISGDLDVLLVARVMKRDQDLVGKPSRVAWL